MDVKRRQFVVVSGLLFAGLAGMPVQSQETLKGIEAAKPAGADAYADEPFVVERIQTIVRFEADGTSRRELTTKVRVQSDAAVKQFGLLVYPYMGSFEKLEVVYVRVRKSDGTVIETPTSDAQELDSEVSRAAPMYTDQKEKHIAVKSLAAKDVLEFRLRWVVQTPLAPGYFWFTDSFVKQGICLDEEIELNVPRDVNTKIVAPAEVVTREEGNRRIYVMHTVHLQEEKEDDKAANTWVRDFYGAAPPEVQLSSFASWAAVGDWFRKVQQNRAEVTPAIRAKAAELTAGTTSEEEKIKAIYGFVATRVRYIGVDLGMGRYTPHAAEDVLNNRYGDCKDKHTLFAALLGAAGIKAYPALISTVYKIDGAVPMPGIFNHVITAVPQAEGSYLFLDTTPEVAPYGLLIQGLRGRLALTVMAEGDAKLVRTPADPPFAILEKYKMDATIQANGTLDGKASWEDRGDTEVILRGMYRDTPQNRWQELVQQFVGRLGFAGTVSEVTASQPENTKEPFRVSYSYHRPKYSDWENRRITLPFPPFFLPQLTEKEKTLKEPLPLGSPQEVVYEASLKLPAGVTPSIPGEVNRSTTFGTYAAEYSFADGTLRGSRRLVLKAHEVPGAERGAWSTFVKAVLDDEQKWIFLEGEFGTATDSQKGVELLRQGRVTEAVDVLQKQVEENPDNVWFKLMLGRAYLRIPDEVKAMELFQGMLDNNEDPAGMLNGVAYELANSNHRISEALEYATRAVMLTEADTVKGDADSAGPLEYRRMIALAAQWDTLGLAEARAGNEAEAEKYLRAAWLLWQRAQVGLHLLELYEKEGKKKEAARICAMALAAPGKDDETDTRQRLAAAQTRLGVPEESYTVSAKPYPRPPVSGAEALSEIRTTKIPLPTGTAHLDQKNATFALVFENGKKEVGVRFVSGAAELKEVGKGLATAKYQVAFPDERPTRLVRMGLLTCSRYTKECTFVLFPMESVPGVF
jgi:tetratricopeptide (TPR) repeat protein